MPITGIDYTKCSQCKQCVNECPTNNYSLDEEKEKVLFNPKSCILCGHCIDICPENAILHENMKGSVIEYKDTSTINSQETLFNVIISKRSIRKYKNKEVPKDILDKVIDSMRYAPTAMNLRSLKCLLISGDQKIREITENIIDTMESDKEKEIYRKRIEDGMNPFFYNAPHILLLHSKGGWGEIDATIAITYAMLFAETLGLGSCWIGGIQKYLSEKKERAEKALGITDNICGIMILGYPAVKFHRSPPRSPLKVKSI